VVYIYIIRAITIISANKNNILQYYQKQVIIIGVTLLLSLTLIMSFFMCSVSFNIFEQVCYNNTAISIIGVHGSSKEQFSYDHRNEAW